MEDSLLTKCPHCKTLFRISYEHLAVAEGQVRCGVCFNVFNAPMEGLSYSEGPGSDRETTFGHKPENGETEDTPTPHSDEPVATEIADEEEAPHEQSLHQESVKDESAEPTTAENDAETTADTSAFNTPELHHMEQLEIAEESLEASIFNAPRKSSDRPLLWGTLSTAALLVLTLQWAWVNKDRYAHESQWHGWYKTACTILSCTLPEYKNIELLNTERLEVRSHPEYRNALVVDMIISNNGRYPQPLPGLNMEFYDLNGAILAQRTFSPANYLANVSNPIRNLPVRTPVRFSFTIIDPGEQAVNYAVRLQENNN